MQDQPSYHEKRLLSLMYMKSVLLCMSLDATWSCITPFNHVMYSYKLIYPIYIYIHIFLTTHFHPWNRIPWISHGFLQPRSSQVLQMQRLEILLSDIGAGPSHVRSWNKKPIETHDRQVTHRPVVATHFFNFHPED